MPGLPSERRDFDVEGNMIRIKKPHEMERISHDPKFVSFLVKIPFSVECRRFLVGDWLTPEAVSGWPNLQALINTGYLQPLRPREHARLVELEDSTFEPRPYCPWCERILHNATYAKWLREMMPHYHVAFNSVKTRAEAYLNGHYLDDSPGDMAEKRVSNISNPVGSYIQKCECGGEMRLDSGADVVCDSCGLIASRGVELVNANAGYGYTEFNLKLDYALPFRPDEISEPETDYVLLTDWKAGHNPPVDKANPGRSVERRKYGKHCAGLMDSVRIWEKENDPTPWHRSKLKEAQNRRRKIWRLIALHSSELHYLQSCPTPSEFGKALLLVHNRRLIKSWFDGAHGSINVTTLRDDLIQIAKELVARRTGQLTTWDFHRLSIELHLGPLFVPGDDPYEQWWHCIAIRGLKA